MKNQVVLMIIFHFLCYSKAQTITPEKIGFQAFKITDKKLGNIDYYVSKTEDSNPLPLLFYVDGSGAMPLIQITENGIMSAIAIDTKTLSKKYRIVLISKPGIPFADTIIKHPQYGFPFYEEPKIYNEKLSLEWRVEALRKVKKHLIKKLIVDKKRIVLFGISEGFQVALKTASIDKDFTHTLAFVGNGLNQFFDMISEVRFEERCGKISNKEAQESIDNLNNTFKNIYQNSHQTDSMWYGHTFKRWASFTQNNPTENLLKIKHPVYIAVSANDKNTSVLGTDYMYLACIQRGKNNVTYKVYPYDHYFNEEIVDQEGKINKIHKMKEVFDEAFNWLDKH